MCGLMRAYICSCVCVCVCLRGCGCMCALVCVFLLFSTHRILPKRKDPVNDGKGLAMLSWQADGELLAAPIGPGVYLCARAYSCVFAYAHVLFQTVQGCMFVCLLLVRRYARESTSTHSISAFQRHHQTSFQSSLIDLTLTLPSLPHTRARKQRFTCLSEAAGTTRRHSRTRP